MCGGGGQAAYIPQSTTTSVATPVVAEKPAELQKKKGIGDKSTDVKRKKSGRSALRIDRATVGDSGSSGGLGIPG